MAGQFWFQGGCFWGLLLGTFSWHAKGVTEQCVTPLACSENVPKRGPGFSTRNTPFCPGGPRSKTRACFKPPGPKFAGARLSPVPCCRGPRRLARGRVWRALRLPLRCLLGVHACTRDVSAWRTACLWRRQRRGRPAPFHGSCGSYDHGMRRAAHGGRGAGRAGRRAGRAGGEAVGS